MPNKPDHMKQVEVEATDVVRLVLQFLEENKLTKSLEMLQAESQVALNTVENLDALVNDVMHGHWDLVLSAVSMLQLPQRLLADLYEQIVIELIEKHELNAAGQLLRSAAPMLAMKVEEPARHARLEMLMPRTHFDAREIYPDGSVRESRRSAISEALRNEVSVVPPSRLLALLGQALKWQQHQGQLPADAKFDVFRGAAAEPITEKETDIFSPGPTIRFGNNSHAECASFSPDGQFLTSGSVDGFVEVWNFEKGKLRKDLSYQAQDQMMMHEEAVLALGWSRDSELLASGSRDGMIKVWRICTGRCVRRFPQPHQEGVTCVGFSHEGTQIISGSFDATIRVHGIKSGKLLKEMRGHTSYVNDCGFSPDGARLVSCSSDGTVRVWDAKTSDCLHEWRLPQSRGSEVSVNCVRFLPGTVDQLVVCNRSPTLYITTLTGELIRPLSSGKREGGDFIQCTISRTGCFIHCVAEDSYLYSFDTSSGKLQHLQRVHDKDPIGLCLHPHRNILATWSNDGILKLWK